MPAVRSAIAIPSARVVLRGTGVASSTPMRVHHLNCISLCPLGGRWIDGRSPTPWQRGAWCCHCLLVEDADSLLLVDTGLGLRDVREPRGRLGATLLRLLRPDFREELTAIRQIERLGFAARDVRDIVLTHLGFDHAGGLDDFPHARVHVLQAELDAAFAQRGWLDRQRYRPPQWTQRANWQVHAAPWGESWFGFQQVSAGRGLPDGVLLVPLTGHTLGHAGVALQREGRWLVHCGDAYFHHREMDVERPRCPPGLALYQRLMAKDPAARLHNQHRLRELQRVAAGQIDLFCAHDGAEFERLAGRPIDVPPRGPAAPGQRGAPA